jgi:hypothetical protein
MKSRTIEKIDVLLVDYLRFDDAQRSKKKCQVICLLKTSLYLKNYVTWQWNKTVFVTASQLNRASVEEIEFDHSHIAVVV